MVDLENTTRSYNGSAWSTSTNVTNAPKAKYIQVHKARLYLAHVKIGSTYHRSRVYYSSIPTSGAITWDVTEDTGNYFEVRTDDGDYIYGISEHGNRLLVLKLNSVHRFYIDDSGNKSLIQIPDAVGTSSGRSVVYHKLNAYSYWYHPRYGVIQYDGGTTKPISLSIQDYVEGVTTPENVVGWVNGFEIIWYVGAVTHPTDTDLNLTNGIFIYDTITQRFSVGELADTVKCATEWFNDSDLETFIGLGNDDKIEHWDNLATSDDGESIEFRVRPSIMWDESPHLVKNYEDGLIYSDPQGSMTVRYRIIGRDGYGRWSEVVGLKDLVEEIDFDTRNSNGRGVQYEFIEYSDDKTPLIEGITNRYAVAGAEEGE